MDKDKTPGVPPADLESSSHQHEESKYHHHYHAQRISSRSRSRYFRLLFILVLTSLIFLFASHLPSAVEHFASFTFKSPAGKHVSSSTTPWQDAFEQIRKGYIDTFPQVPEWSITDDHDNTTKYLTYLPNSGFNNQRIEFENALTLSRMLNRTLLVPNIRLGQPLSWKPKQLLQAYVDREQKSTLAPQCKSKVKTLEKAPKNSLQGPCKSYAKYAEVSPAFLFDVDKLENFSVTQRYNITRQFLFSPKPHGLGLLPSDVLDFNDNDRYHHVFFEDVTTEGRMNQYKRRMNIDILTEYPYSRARLLEFGSLFGSGRLRLRTKQAHEIMNEARDAMVLKIDPLEGAVDSIVQLLGGSENYIGLHLRIGNGIFKTKRKYNMRKVYRHLLTAVQMGPGRVEGFLREQAKERNSKSTSSGNNNVDSTISSSTTTTAGTQNRQSQMSPLLQCRQPLHTHPKLQTLNRPVYIATDSLHPSRDPILEPFYRAFPCIFSQEDFKKFPGLSDLSNIRSEQEGIRLNGFLSPFIDAMVASRGNETLGTPGSTFTSFTSRLHDVYKKDMEKYKNKLPIIDYWGE